MKEQMIREITRPLTRHLRQFLDGRRAAVDEYFRQKFEDTTTLMGKSIATSGELWSAVDNPIDPAVRRLMREFAKAPTEKLLDDYFQRKSIALESEQAKVVTSIFQEAFSEEISDMIYQYVSALFFAIFKNKMLDAYSHYGKSFFKNYIHNNGKNISAYIAQHASSSVVSKHSSAQLTKVMATIINSIVSELDRHFYHYDNVRGRSFKAMLSRAVHEYAYEAFAHMIKLDFLDAFLKRHSGELIASLELNIAKINVLLAANQVDTVIETYLVPKIEHLSKAAIQQLKSVFIENFLPYLSYEQKQMMKKTIDAFASQAYDYLYTKVTRLFIKLLLAEELRQEQGPMPELAVMLDIIEQMYVEYFNAYLNGRPYEQRADIGYDMNPLDPGIVASYPTDTVLQTEMSQYISPKEYPRGFLIHTARTVNGALEYEQIRGTKPAWNYGKPIVPQDALSPAASSSTAQVQMSSSSAEMQSIMSTSTDVGSPSGSSDESLSEGSEPLSNVGSPSLVVTEKVSGYGSLYNSRSSLPSVDDFPNLIQELKLESAETIDRENARKPNVIKPNLDLRTSSEQSGHANYPSISSSEFIKSGP